MFNVLKKYLWLVFLVLLALIFIYYRFVFDKITDKFIFGTMPSAPFIMSRERFYIHPYGLDKDGILYFDYESRYENLGKYNNPTFVAAYADSLYHEISQGNKSLIGDFIKQVDYLLSKADIDKSGDLYWSYPFANPYFNAPEGWYSGMASGRVLGVLARAHYLTKDEKYLKAAEKVCNKLIKPVKRAGMSTYEGKGKIWLEEVAYPKAESFKVLNGHIYGLSGLYDYANYINDKKLKDIAEDGFNTVLVNLEKIDAGFISYYCENMPGREVSYAELGGYNVTHIHQLLYCYQITNNPQFLEKAMRLQLYENFQPKITASFTTNSSTHGTDKMNLTFGNNYWSSYKFPVTVTMDLLDKISFEAITIIGRVPETMPSDYRIFKKIGDEPWELVYGNIKKGKKIHKIVFPTTKEADQVKIEIKSSNNKQVVALEGIGIQREKTDLSPIFIYKDLFRTTTGNYNLKLKNLFSKNPSVYKDPNNYVVIAEDNKVDLLIPYKGMMTMYGEFTKGRPKIQASFSINLKDWESIDSHLELNQDKLELNFNRRGFVKLRLLAEKQMRLIELNL